MKEIKEGYKMTELGEIPNEWEIKTLLECSKDKLKYGIGAAAVEYDVTLPLYLRITDIDDSGRYIKRNKACVNDPESNKYILEEGDIVFARTGNTVGKSYLYKKVDGELVYAGFLIKASINNTIADARFIKNICETKYYWDWVKVMSTRSGQPGINAEEYGKFKFTVPTLPEQQKIADILSTVDEQINNVDRLIEKTKELKKGLMQQLLTKGIGHTEFKETEVGVIPKEWEVKKLGDICSIMIGGTPSRSKLEYWDTNKTTNNIWISIKDLTSSNMYINDSSEYITNLGIEKSNVKEIPPNTVLMSFKLTIGKTAITTKKVYTNEAIAAFFTDNKVIDFMYLYYQLPGLNYDTDTAIKGATLNKEKLNNTYIAIPTVIEQKQIANALLSFDNELVVQLNKRDKLQQLKKGLMQQLLTGKIRVKVDEV